MFLRRHADRIPLLHIKDMAEDGTPVDVGEGTLDIPGHHRRPPSMQEWSGSSLKMTSRGPSPLESARLSLENLRKL